MHIAAVAAKISRSGYPTKTGMTRALREAGIKASASAIAEALSLAEQAIQARKSRPSRYGNLASGAFSWRDGGRKARAPQKYYTGTPAQRLDALRKRTVWRSAPLRSGAAGGSSHTVTLTDDPAAVGYRVVVSENRDTYRGRFKGWAAREDHHRIVVPADWRVRVLRRGLANLSGLFTLDAQPLEVPTPQGVTVYRATWAAQGRGYDVTTHRGYIAHGHDEHYHADTPEAALAGLRRKLKAHFGEIGAPLTVVEFAAWARSKATPRAVVRVTDARRVGACEYGIRSWCHRVGLPYEVGEAPMADVIAAYEREPQREARAAILLALRRYIKESDSDER